MYNIEILVWAWSKSSQTGLTREKNLSHSSTVYIVEPSSLVTSSFRFEFDVINNAKNVCSSCREVILFYRTNAEVRFEHVLSELVSHHRCLFYHWELYDRMWRFLLLLIYINWCSCRKLFDDCARDSTRSSFLFDLQVLMVGRWDGDTRA